MHKKRYYIPLIVATIFLVSGLFISYTGTLLYMAVNAIALAIIGIVFLIYALSEAKSNKGLIIVSCLILMLGGKELIAVGIDAVQGAKEIHITDCSVSKSNLKGSLRRKYKLNGVDENGKKYIFDIGEELYKEYVAELDFSVDLIGWKHSEVIKEIK